MNKTKRYFHLILIINFIVGFIYIAFRYFVKRNTDFGLESYEVQRYLQYIHIVLVPFLVFSFGCLFSEHVVPKLRKNERKKKKSGLSLVILSVFMIASGYCIQIVLRGYEVVGIFHSIISVIFILFYVYHLSKKI